MGLRDRITSFGTEVSSREGSRICHMLEILKLFKVEPWLDPHFGLIELLFPCVNCLHCQVMKGSSNNLLLGLHHASKLQKCILQTESYSDNTSDTICQKNRNEIIIFYSCVVRSIQVKSITNNDDEKDKCYAQIYRRISQGSTINPKNNTDTIRGHIKQK